MRSIDPETMHLLSGENATDQTDSVCPRRGSLTSVPVSELQMRIVLSYEPEIIFCPLGENATDATTPECSCNT